VSATKALDSEVLQLNLWQLVANSALIIASPCSIDETIKADTYRLSRNCVKISLPILTQNIEQLHELTL